MTDRAGFFAGLSDILTAMCIYYVVAGILIMGRRWGLHPVWLLLCAAACAFLFAALLKKPRSTPLLTAVTAALFAAVMGVFLLATKTPPTFGYVLVLAVGAGMGVGLPLYTCLNRPQVLRHLTHLDVLIIALLAVLLTRQALGIDGGTVALMVIVLFMDAASAVGLRMSDGEAGDSGNAFKASMVALGAAAALALLIGLFTMIFSRSGAVTDSVLHGIGGFFAVLGGGIERLFRWFANLVYRERRYDTLHLEDMPSVAALEQQNESFDFSVNTTAVGIALCVLALAAAVLVAVVLRKKTFARGTKTAAAASNAKVRRTGGTAGALLEKLRAALRFRWAAFQNRDTPGGLLVYLERRGRRARTPRGRGESMREFIARMDGSGGLDELSDALDREYYGGEKNALGAKRCRELRRYMRNIGKAVQHG